MANFDATIDNRWRPDFASSQQRVREEEAEEKEKVHYSPELSFVPAKHKQDDAAYDAATRSLIERYRQLELQLHGTEVAQLVEKWKCLDAMASAEAKQRFLEEHIYAVRREPEKNEARLIFLMLVLEPIRRSVSKKFIRAQGGFAQAQDFQVSNRAELRMLQHIDREALFDVTRRAALEAVFRYPAPAPKALFPWFRATISYRALDEIKGDLPEPETTNIRGSEAEAVSDALAGFKEIDPPKMRSNRLLGAWMRRVSMRDIFDTVENFYDFDEVRVVCNAAIGRLSPGQQDIIKALYLEDKSAETIATSRGVTRSTVDNQASQGRKRMEKDDEFFSALCEMGRVRDQARARDIRSKYPDGLMPDGRRIVVIEDAA